MKNTATIDRRSARRQNIIQSATLYAKNTPVMSPGSAVQIGNISTSGISFESCQASDVDSICRVMITARACD